MKQVTVKKNEENPEPDQVIADHLRRISEAMRRLDSGPLKRHTLVLLLHDYSKVSKRDINLILDGIEALEQTYLKPGKV